MAAGLLVLWVPGGQESSGRDHPLRRGDGWKPCVGGTRVTVGTVVGLVAAGKSTAEILAAYPYLDEQDVMEALAYAAWRVEEIEIPISA